MDMLRHSKAGSDTQEILAMMIVGTFRTEPRHRHLALLNDTSKNRLLKSQGSPAVPHDTCDSHAPALCATGASGAEGDAQELRCTVRRSRAHSAMPSYGTRYNC